MKKLSSFNNTNSKTKYTVIAEQDAITGDIVLPLPDELIQQLQWQVGDTLHFDDSQLEQGIKITNLTKEECNGEKIFIVEALSQFKIRYAIKGKSLEHAFDTVTCEEANELNQEWLGETILGGHEVTKEQYLNDYSFEEFKSLWTEQQKMNLIHKINYKKD